MVRAPHTRMPLPGERANDVDADLVERPLLAIVQRAFKVYHATQSVVGRRFEDAAIIVRARIEPGDVSRTEGSQRARCRADRE